jgi:hypothetical protein
MPYFNNIPQATDRLSKSQYQLLANFASIQHYFTVNHIDFDASNKGKHSVLTMPLQAADPVILATEGALYTKTCVASAQPELFFKRGLSAPIQMTGMGNVTAPVGTNKGWSYLPSGLLIKWVGNLRVVGPTTTEAVSFVGIGPAFTGMFASLVTIQSPNAVNKTLYIKDYNVGTETVTLHTTLRYGGNTGISDYYINLLVIGV